MKQRKMKYFYTLMLFIFTGLDFRDCKKIAKLNSHENTSAKINGAKKKNLLHLNISSHDSLSLNHTT